MAPLRRGGSPEPADAARVDQWLTQKRQVVAAVGETVSGIEEVEQGPDRGGGARGRRAFERDALRDDVDPEQAPHGLGGPQCRRIVSTILLGQQDARKRVGVDGLAEPERPEQHLEAHLAQGHGEEQDRVVGTSASAAQAA